MSVLSSQRRNTGKINPGVGAERGEAATVMSGGETGLCLDYSEEGAGFICLVTISLTRHEQRVGKKLITHHILGFLCSKLSLTR